MRALDIGAGFAVARRGGTGAPAASFDFTAGALPSGASLTRASAGTYTNASGAIASASSNVARFDYNPATLAPRGLLIEPAATNLAPYSTDLTQTSFWATQTNLSAVSATRITENTVTGQHGVFSAATVAVSAGTPITFSAIASEVAGSAKRYFSFWLSSIGFSNNGSSTSIVAIFDTATFTLTLLTSLGAPVGATYSATCVQTAGGALCTVTITPFASGNASIALRLASSSASSAAYSGDGTSALNIGEVQAESGSVASSRVRTTSATATRAADVLTLNWGGKGVADGAVTLRYTFDDGSTQDVAVTIASGTTTAPTNLNRARLRGVALV